MKRLHVIVLAVVSVFAFVAIAATSAFAANELLFNGAKSTESLPLAILGEIMLHDLSNNAEILCVGILDGTVDIGGKTGQITEALMDEGVLLAETTLNLALVSVSGDDFECTPVKLCENMADVLVVAFNLPWDWEIQEVAAGVLAMVILNGEYKSNCLLLGVPLENICGGEAWAKLLADPVTGDAAAAFEAAFGPEGTCDNGDLAEVFVDSSLLDPLVEEPVGALVTFN